MSDDLDQAEQDVAEAKAALDAETAKPIDLIAKLSPEGIDEQIALLNEAKVNYARDRKSVV